MRRAPFWAKRAIEWSRRLSRSRGGRIAIAKGSAIRRLPASEWVPGGSVFLMAAVVASEGRGEGEHRAAVLQRSEDGRWRRSLPVAGKQPSQRGRSS